MDIMGKLQGRSPYYVKKLFTNKCSRVVEKQLQFGKNCDTMGI